MPDEEDRIEQLIASDLASFLNGTTAEQELAQSLAGLLGRLFEQLLAGEECWSPFLWIDDASPEWMEARDGSTVELAGLFYPGQERGPLWVQPFRATFHLDPSRTGLDAFRVCLVEAGSAINAVPFEGRRPRHWPHVQHWAFTFERSAPSDLRRVFG